MDNEKILEEIDKMHHLANESLSQKKIDSYINLFSANLKYKQINGITRDKTQLAEDTALYFSRLKTSTSQYERQSYSINENKFTENLIQKASASIRVFIFFTKKWTVEREGIYQWSKHESIWKIEEVEILSEKVY